MKKIGFFSLLFGSMAIGVYAQPTIDGTLTDTEYGSEVTFQTVQTDFGDNNDANPAGANGSEADNLYLYDDDNFLYVGVGGNMQTNGNFCTIFINVNDASGAATIPSGGYGYAVGTVLPFTADIALLPNAGGGDPQQDLYMNIHNYQSGSQASNYLGSITGDGSAATPTIGTISGDISVVGLTNVDGAATNFDLGLDNTNIVGVEGGTGAASTTGTGITTGLELKIPMAMLDELNGATLLNGDDVEIVVAITGGDFFSNQLLPPLATPSGNLGNNPDISGESAVSYTLSGQPAVSTVTVDSGATADGQTVFNTIQDAIESFCSLGSNAPATPPFTINVVPGGGPYTEQLSLDSNLAGIGDVQGDLTIQSSVGGTLVYVALQLGKSDDDDAVELQQVANDITFRDLLFYPSQTAPVFTDEFFKIDEPGADANDNVITFDGCIVTEIDAGGNPLITTKAAALQPAPVAVGSTRTTAARMIQVWGDNNNEAMSLTLNNTALYGNNAAGTADTLRFSAQTATDKLIITDSIISGGGGQMVALAGPGPITTITNSTIAYPASQYYSCVRLTGLSGGSVNVDGSTFITENLNAYGIRGSGFTAAVPVVVTNSIFDNLEVGTGARCISGAANMEIQVSDSILMADGLATVFVPGVANNVADCTFYGPGNAIFASGGTSSIDVIDSVFAGPGVAIADGGTVPTGGVNVTYSVFADGTDGVDSAGTTPTLGAGILYVDPAFVSLDPASTDCVDVQNTALATASSTAGPLDGGGDYVGGVNPAAPNLAGVPASIAYSTLDPGQTETQSVTFANAAGSASYSVTEATLVDAKLAADFTVLTALPVVVGDGASEIIEIQYTAAAGAGASAADLTLDGPGFTAAVVNLNGESTEEADWMLLND